MRNPRKTNAHSLGNSLRVDADGKRKHREPIVSSPRTGVGTPDDHVEAAGAELGGDTGDVGTPRNDIGDSVGGTRGSSGIPEASVVVEPGPGKGMSTNKRRAA